MARAIKTFALVPPKSAEKAASAGSAIKIDLGGLKLSTDQIEKHPAECCQSRALGCAELGGCGGTGSVFHLLHLLDLRIRVGRNAQAGVRGRSRRQGAGSLRAGHLPTAGDSPASADGEAGFSSVDPFARGFVQMRTSLPHPCKTFVVKVVSRCNLNCSYCYMYNLQDRTWRNQPGIMSAEVRIISPRKSTRTPRDLTCQAFTSSCTVVSRSSWGGCA